MKTKTTEIKTPHAEAFSFGDPEPVLSGRDYMDMMEVQYTGHYFEPPISLDGLSKAYRANQHHASAMQVKRNIIVSCYQPNPLLSAGALSKFVFDYLVFGNGYFEIVKNRLGSVMALKPVLAKHMRRMRAEDKFILLNPGGEDFEFKAGSIIHLKAEDLNQEVYGTPEYLAALQSALLNEAATLFRRKYYVNGSHAGFIMYMTDAAQDQGDIDNLRQALKDSKGPGNFKNLFMYSPNGDKDGLKIIPLAEVAAKDEFLNIKNVTRDDVLAAHRVPPQMMGIIPNNTGGFGNASDASKVFARNELKPLMTIFKEINHLIGQEVIKFDDYVIDDTSEESSKKD